MNQESLRGKDSELRIRVEFDRIQIRPSKKTDKIICWNFSIYVIHIREAAKKILH